MDCAGDARTAYWSKYRRSSFPHLAGMDIVRSFRWVLWVVSRNSDERVNDEVRASTLAVD